MTAADRSHRQSTADHAGRPARIEAVTRDLLASAELHAVEARLREAEAVLAEIRANAAELLDADDDSYDGSLSAIWAVELIDTYKTTKTENGSER